MKTFKMTREMSQEIETILFFGRTEKRDFNSLSNTIRFVALQLSHVGNFARRQALEYAMDILVHLDASEFYAGRPDSVGAYSL